MKKTQKRKPSPLSAARKRNKELRERLQAAETAREHMGAEKEAAVSAMRLHALSVQRMRETLNHIGDRELQLCHIGARIRDVLAQSVTNPEVRLNLKREIEIALTEVGL